jgi:hypothetical protein
MFLKKSLLVAAGLATLNANLVEAAVLRITDDSPVDNRTSKPVLAPLAAQNTFQITDRLRGSAGDYDEEEQRVSARLWPALIGADAVAVSLLGRDGERGTRSLPSADADVQMVRTALGARTVVVKHPHAAFLRGVFDGFASAACEEGAASKLVWVSGNASTTADGVYMLLAAPGGKATGTAAPQASADVPAEELLGKLAASDCHFVVGLDAEPPAYVFRVPRNVTVIWASTPGGLALDSAEGSVLSMAFATALTERRTWRVDELQARLQADASAALSKASATGKAQTPWIQSGQSRRTAASAAQTRIINFPEIAGAPRVNDPDPMVTVTPAVVERSKRERWHSR